MKKRKFLLCSGIGMVILMILPLSLGGCQNRITTKGEDKPVKNTSQNHIKTFSKTDFVMNTVLQETLYGTEDITQKIKDLLSSIETEQLSWREEDSEVAQINEKCGQGQTVTMSDDFAKWVEVSLELAEKSEGAFDPTIGTLTRLWNIEGENPKVPSQDKINEALCSIGYEHINIEETEKTISMDKGYTLDLGAVGKGIGCDVVRESLEADDCIEGAVIAVGGSVLTYGEKPDGTEWNVAVRDPQGEEGTYMGVLNIEGTSCISTSGDYEKYFIQDGKKYHHILDPDTGYPAESGLTSVTVVLPEEGEWKDYAGLLSDGLSTACFVLGKEKGMELLNKYDAEGIFIDKNQKVSITDGLTDSFEILNNAYSLQETEK